MSRKINNLIIIFQIFVCYNLHAHKDGHKSKESIKSIGVLTGTIIDSLSSEPLKYASISLIDVSSFLKNEITPNKNVQMLYIYEDGAVLKRFIIE